MELAPWIALAVFAVDLMIRIGLSVRVIMRRRPVGVSLAWLSIVLILPLFGALVYLMFGELRLGDRRAKWAREIHDPYDRWLKELRHRARVDWSRRGPECEPLARLVENSVGIPALPGNRLQLLDDWNHTFDALIADIESARRTCHLEFYIWNAGGRGDEVIDALVRAAQRGVTCRVLVDDMGSRAFLRSEQAQRLRDGGVQLLSALPGGLWRMLFVRFDLRLHRKIVVIDGRVGYTGSLNLVDPRYFKQDAGVGQWVDAMARIEGPVVEPLAITFLEDWALESPETLGDLQETGDVHPLRPRDGAPAQVAPSGPAYRIDAIERIVLMAIYAARKELVLTTPYFVPDESLVAALIAAAQRGVEVTLIVPARVDSMLVRYASQAFKGDLLAAGVRVMQFDDGLLHTKSITIDGEMCLFGSLNLDPRSMHLNFEITLAIYEADFTRNLRALQQSYIDRSTPMEYARWRDRSVLERFTENAARLLGPLL